jgi:Zn-dependent metalloprotease
VLDLKNCRVDWDNEKYIPRKVYGFETKSYSGTPQEIAQAFVEENLEVLKISVPINSLRFEKTIEGLGAWTVLFQQYQDETPIHGARVTVNINLQNRVFMVKNNTVPSVFDKPLAKAKSIPLKLSEIDSLIQKRAKELGGLSTPIDKESMIYDLKGSLREVWKVKFGTLSPVGSWILFIDKYSGDILDERDVLWKYEAKGQVFIPNPVVALDKDNLIDLGDKEQEVLAKAYRKVKLDNLAGDGYLKGSYVDTGNTVRRAKSDGNQFVYSRKDERFGEVMAYYHIDSLQSYLQSLGFNGEKKILNRPIMVKVHGVKEDQSWFDPSPGKEDLTFGSGGVNDAEDGDIIIHEYGHAIANGIVRGFGQSKEARAMGEGLSDYLAASFFERFKTASRKVKIGEWDAKGYTAGSTECLRRLDSKKHFPEDMRGEGHDDGEIWSTCLWAVRRVLGRKKADTVILESMYYLDQYSGFKDGADAILMAEKNLYGSKKEKALTKIFKDSGIL